MGRREPDMCALTMRWAGCVIPRISGFEYLPEGYFEYDFAGSIKGAPIKVMAGPPMKPPRFHLGLTLCAALIWSDLETVGVIGVSGVWQHVSQLMTLVAIKQRYAGHANRAALIAAAHSYMGWFVIIVDDDVDPSNLADVIWGATTRCEPSDQIDIVRNAWSSALDPRIPEDAKRAGIASHSKLIIEAVRPFTWKDSYPTTSSLTSDEAREIEAKWGGAHERGGQVKRVRRQLHGTGASR
jgi:3-polyprenyl-4-hydroxybenzoate decarboxylase